MIIIHITTNFAAVCHMLLLCKGVCQCSAVIQTGNDKIWGPTKTQQWGLMRT